MFGIGRLERRTKAVEEAVTLHSVELDGIAELRAALSLFARRCDQCGQWKRIDAKGWMVREGEKRSLWGRCMGMYPGPDRYPADYICPDCMAALKPEDVDTPVNMASVEPVEGNTCCSGLRVGDTIVGKLSFDGKVTDVHRVTATGRPKPEKRKEGKAK